MLLDYEAVHFDLHEDTKNWIEERMEKVEFAKDLLVDVKFTFTKEKNRFFLEAKIHFRWGKSHVIKEKSYDLHEGLNSLLDSVEAKVKKEKDKVKEH